MVRQKVRNRVLNNLIVFGGIDMSVKKPEHEKKHLLKLRPYLAECMVLLKTDGRFPLPAPCDIALYGNGALSFTGNAGETVPGFGHDILQSA